MNIQELTSAILAFRDARDWKQFHNPKDLALSLSIEVGELLEHFRFKTVEEVHEHMQANKEAVSHELADILYHVLLIAHDEDINLGKAFFEKLERMEEKYPVEKARGNNTKYTEL